MHVDGDSPAIICHLNPTVLVNGDIYLIAAASYGLIDAVIDDLIHQVVKPPLPGAADVHPGATAYRLKAIQDLDVLSGVIVVPVHLRLVNCYPPLKEIKLYLHTKLWQSFTEN